MLLGGQLCQFSYQTGGQVPNPTLGIQNNSPRGGVQVNHLGNQGYHPVSNEVCIYHPENHNNHAINRDEAIEVIREQVREQFQGQIRDQLIDQLIEQFGTILRAHIRPQYQKPYLEFIDQMFEFPRHYRIPDFTLFSGVHKQPTLEHIAHFTT